MARFRLSGPAKADIAAILRRSEELHGREARNRYKECLAAAINRIASHPDGRSTVDRADLDHGVRSFHSRHSRNESRGLPVAAPAHVIFYRVTEESIVEVIRVLHDRMEPRRHIGPEDEGRSGDLG